MGVLRAIGGFFAKIGRWIRDTAWVQPLLIVGGIFAIIFSIPYIVDGVQGWFDSGNASENFYRSFQLSLENSDERSSDADNLLYYIEKQEQGVATAEDEEKYGTQFFLMFVQRSCAGCETVQPGFETLQRNWNSSEFIPNSEVSDEFKLYTIFIDEETDAELNGSETTFTKYFWDNHAGFFEQAATSVEDRPYYAYMGGESSDYAGLLNDISEPETFQTPTIFMIDFENPESPTWTYGISDILFNFEGRDGGTSNYALARTLIDCWNHSGVFNGDK